MRLILPCNSFSRRFVSAFILIVALLGAAMMPGQVRAMETLAEQAFIVDLSTGSILLDKNAHERMPTSSMSKVMTIYMVFDALQNGIITLDDTFPVSEKAWRKGGSKMFVEVGKRVRVEDLIRGVIVQSGNDATIVLAEGLAGSEDAFAEMMNAKAKELGMDQSHFVNASGWPDPEHYSTAHDLAVLAAAVVRDFPGFYHYYGEQEFTYSGITQPNRNPLVQSGLADGLKTGHTEAAGYGLIGSAERDGRRIVMVLNGMDSTRQRAQESERLLNWAFRSFETVHFFDADQVVYDAPVWLGEDATVELVVPEDITLTVKRADRANIKTFVRYEEPVPAPIQAGQRVGELVLSIPDEPEQTFALIAKHNVERLSPWKRIGAALQYLIFGAPVSPIGDGSSS